jgi:hypothetical protein
LKTATNPVTTVDPEIFNTENMMEILSKADLQRLIQIRDQCCISIFMPTHRSTAEMEQDQIRFKNLLAQAKKSADDMLAVESSLGDKLASAERLLQDESFWRQTADGLALFISAEQFLHFRLPFKFDELLVSAGRFQIKPLLPLFSGDGRFYILALSQNEVRLFQCSRFSAMQIDLPAVAGGLRETLRYDDESGTQLQFHTGTAAGIHRRPAMYHGHAVDAEHGKEEIVQYFREVDRSVQKILRAETAPLVLAGVDYLLPLYKSAAAYTHLLDDGISGNPEGRRPEDLHAAAWSIVQPYFKKSQQEALGLYHRNAGTGLTSSDLRQIVPNAWHSRVEVLFVALAEQRWGRYDPDRNVVMLQDRALEDSEDLLNLAAVETLMHGGTVYALNSDELPELESPAAALLRF